MPLQPPFTVTPPRTLGAAAWQFASALALEVAGQISVGVALPVTVKLEFPTPALSVALTFKVIEPLPVTVVPFAEIADGLGIAAPIQRKNCRAHVAME